MTAAFTLVALGFLLGIRHAVDPDHVVAVGTMASRVTSFRRSATLGVLWGVGHTLTVLTVGGAIVLMRTAMSPRLALGLELGVALMLIVLGLLNLVTARHVAPAVPASPARPLLVGMVHGMAGSAAIALLVLSTIREPAVGVMYLLFFGAGTVAGMVLVTAAVVRPVAIVLDRAGVSRRWLTTLSGVASLGFGVFLAYSLGGPAALFAAAPAVIGR